METINQDFKEKKESSKIKTLILTIVIIVMFILGVGAGYLVYNRLVEKEDNNSKDINQQQVEEILDELEEVILLPEGESPTVAFLYDIEELKKENGEFYKDAQEGDLVIIYSDKAIIYRRENKKVINVAPVFIETENLSE